MQLNAQSSNIPVRISSTDPADRCFPSYPLPTFCQLFLFLPVDTFSQLVKQEKQKASPTIYSAINKESFAHFRILRNNCCRTVGGHAPAAFNWDTGILRSQPEMTNSTQQGICCSVVKYCSCLVLSLFPFADCVFNEILARTSCLHFFYDFLARHCVFSTDRQARTLFCY